MDRAMINRAISKDSSPTPGYLLDEIAKMTHADFEGCKSLEKVLFDRLKLENPYTKFKCLAIIKHVCLKGRPEFKKDMQRNVETIKDCLSFKGLPDPLRGDELNRKVREIAKDTLEAIYSDSCVFKAPNGLYKSGNRIEGIGGGVSYIDSNSAMSHGVGSSFFSVHSASYPVRLSGHDAYMGNLSSGPEYHISNNSGLSGMGNYDPSESKTWLERASQTVKATAIRAAEVIDARTGSGRGGNSLLFTSSSGNTPGGYLSNRGSQAFNSGSYMGVEAPQSVYQNPANLNSTNESNLEVKSQNLEHIDFELAAVQKVCTTTGTRSVPNKEEKEEFLSLALKMDQHKVGEALLAVASNSDSDQNGGLDSWRRQSKALALIGALIQKSDAYRDFFTEAVENDMFTLILQSERSLIRDKGTSLVRRLGLDIDQSTAPSNNSTRTVDILGGDLLGEYDNNLLIDGNSTIEKSATGTIFDVQKDSKCTGLFDDMNLKSDETDSIKPIIGESLHHNSTLLTDTTNVNGDLLSIMDITQSNGPTKSAVEKDSSNGLLLEITEDLYAIKEVPARGLIHSSSSDQLHGSALLSLNFSSEKKSTSFSFISCENTSDLNKSAQFLDSSMPVPNSSAPVSDSSVPGFSSFSQSSNFSYSNVNNSILNVYNSLPNINSSSSGLHSSSNLLNGSMSVINSSKSVSNMQIPVLNSSIPALNGSMPGSNSSLPILNSSTPVLNSSYVQNHFSPRNDIGDFSKLSYAAKRSLDISDLYSKVPSSTISKDAFSFVEQEMAGLGSAKERPT